MLKYLMWNCGHFRLISSVMWRVNLWMPHFACIFLERYGVFRDQRYNVWISRPPRPLNQLNVLKNIKKHYSYAVFHLFLQLWILLHKHRITPSLCSLYFPQDRCWTRNRQEKWPACSPYSPEKWVLHAGMWLLLIIIKKCLFGDNKGLG